MTFSPRISATASKIESPPGKDGAPVPVHERLSVNRQYVQEILTQIKTEIEMSNCTFKPEINPSSAIKAAEKRYGEH